jgi:hypothetical protein
MQQYKVLQQQQQQQHCYICCVTEQRGLTEFN